jgi:prepilin-type N-terminal cleavage/methylation domain-containing protein
MFVQSQPTKVVTMMEAKRANEGHRRGPRAKQDGMTLAELMVVIVIAAVLASVAYTMVPRVMSNFRAGKITDELHTVIPTIQAAYQNQTSFANLTTSQVAKNGWIGQSWVEMAAGVPTGNLVTQWGTITFVPNATGSQVTATLTNIPARECTTIGPDLANDLYVSGSINGTVAKVSANNVDLDVVGNQCTSTTTNTIAVTFGRA